MKVLIVEDEKIAAQQLISYIQSFERSIEVLDVISSCKALNKWIQKAQDVDLVFCDIELSDGNVLNTLKKSEMNAAVIFTTAYDNFWSQALKLNGIDYLLKPLTKEKVHLALTKAETIKRIFSKEQMLLSKLTSLLGEQKNTFYKKRFPVRLNNEVFVLETEAIHFFRIVEGVIFAFTGKDKKYPLIEGTLNELETKLNPEYFFRINRSEIINAQFLDTIRIQNADDYIIHMKGVEDRFTVSNSRVTKLKEWLENS
jgi:DNA-binding LytR/AlgR family response regulator